MKMLTKSPECLIMLTYCDKFVFVYLPTVIEMWAGGDYRPEHSGSVPTLNTVTTKRKVFLIKWN